MIIFETPRLIIRQLTKNDLQHFFDLNGNEEVVRYIRPAVNREEAEKSLLWNIAFYASHPNLGRWAVIEKATNTFAGSFALIPIEQEKEILQIGYALLPQFWGMGYASELVQFGKPFFFEHHFQDILYAVTEQPNLASQQVLLKSGFVLVGNMMEGTKLLIRFKIDRPR
jgi:[ribosomal protein S5]-alanine N-acetyltransferase